MRIPDNIDPLKRTEKLSDLERDILETLTTRRVNKQGFTTVELRNAIVRNGGYEGRDPPIGEMKDALRGLIQYGSVRSYTDNQGNQHYRLSRFIGSGKRDQVTLQGKANPFLDIYKYIRRIAGSFFMLVGLGVIFYAGLSPTGKAIASTAPSFSIGLLLSFALVLLGIIILFQVSKK